VFDPLETDHRFGSSEPFAIGVEEELFLVDPLTGRPANTSAVVLERLGEVEGTVEQELHACQVELITNICTGAREAAQALGEMRRAVLETGAGILASGTHPSATAMRVSRRDRIRPPRLRSGSRSLISFGSSVVRGSGSFGDRFAPGRRPPRGR
jgi:glutamate---cysteine ligase / carboxylate-amine ligase